MNARFWSSAAPALVVLALTATPLAAHHGWSGNTEPITVSGELVSAVSLSGPHATMQIRDADGQIWDITLAPAPRTSRAGLSETTVPLGAQVTVEGQRNSDASRHEVKVRRVTWDGQHYDVYPPG